MRSRVEGIADRPALFNLAIKCLIWFQFVNSIQNPFLLLAEKLLAPPTIQLNKMFSPCICEPRTETANHTNRMCHNLASSGSLPPFIESQKKRFNFSWKLLQNAQELNDTYRSGHKMKVFPLNECLKPDRKTTPNCKFLTFTLQIFRA